MYRKKSKYFSLTLFVDLINNINKITLTFIKGKRNPPCTPNSSVYDKLLDKFK